jgi:hypothetical protein
MSPSRPAAARTKAVTRKAISPPVSARERLVGFALLAPPGAWALHLGVSYGLVYPAVRHGSKDLLYTVTVLALSLAAAGGGVAAWHLRGARPKRDSASDTASTFAFEGALALSSFFALVILAQTVPVLLLNLGD